MKICLLIKPDKISCCSSIIQARGFDLIREPDHCDYIISYLHPKKIPLNDIKLAKRGAINFHPSPPNYGGLMMATTAIMENANMWGVTCHYMNGEFDQGDVIQFNQFHIDPHKATAFELDKLFKHKLHELFRDFINQIYNGIPLLGRKRDLRNWKYFSRKHFEENREIKEGDDWDRKIRAYYYPPHKGAYIERHGKEYYPMRGEELDTLF